METPPILGGSDMSSGRARSREQRAQRRFTVRGLGAISMEDAADRVRRSPPSSCLCSPRASLPAHSWLLQWQLAPSPAVELCGPVAPASHALACFPGRCRGVLWRLVASAVVVASRVEPPLDCPVEGTRACLRFFCVSTTYGRKCPWEGSFHVRVCVCVWPRSHASRWGGASPSPHESVASSVPSEELNINVRPELPCLARVVAGDCVCGGKDQWEF